ncbi:MAG: flagella basal body P-ring formation protein FlgA [Alphaproteobacteria bacterium PRO2]|nr:flagella basal body P-ring formation protein FlgA [Alphaproteobacteria bacterium PRO2]
MVRKTVLAFLTVIAVLAGTIVLPQSARAISLKQNSVVTGDTITLGDVFQGLPANNEKVLGLAPQPGQEMVLNARTLLRIAVALDLPWRPMNSGDHIVLTRAASIVDRDMIEEALRMKIANEGISGKYKIIIPDVSSRITLSPDIAPGVEITEFTIKPETGWFEAMAVAPSVANPVSRTKINGTVQKLVDVPVLRETLKAGDVIGARDIDYIEMSEKEIRQDMLLKEEEIVGMTPRRMTSPGKPLKTIDLEAPQVITRGDIVTMLFQSGALTLTASGKAMEHGAKGDVIRVVNNSSKKTIEGLVTGEKEVTITSF